MTRLQMLLLSTAVAIALPSGVAFSQAPGGSTAPAVGPIVNPARTLPASPEDVRSPMQEPPMAPSANVATAPDACGPSNAATIMDEFGRKYDCRGQRLR